MCVQFSNGGPDLYICQKSKHCSLIEVLPANKHKIDEAKYILDRREVLQSAGHSPQIIVIIAKTCSAAEAIKQPIQDLCKSETNYHYITYKYAPYNLKHKTTNSNDWNSDIGCL